MMTWVFRSRLLDGVKCCKYFTSMDLKFTINRVIIEPWHLFHNAGLWRKRRQLQWLIGSSMFLAASTAISPPAALELWKVKDSWISFNVAVSGIKRQEMKVWNQQCSPFTPLLTQLDLLIFTFCCHKKEIKEKKISSSNRIKHRQSWEQINAAIKLVCVNTPVLLPRSTWRRAFCVPEHKTTPHLSFLSALFHP